jgi:DNA-binding beta-propeller fold protein YncE
VTPLLLAVLVAESIALPGGPPVGMDYVAYDAATDRIWLPAGNTGNVDVVDAKTGKVSVIGGFPTAPSTRPGRRVGPSSVTIAGDVAWVGNRADNRLSSFDARTLAPRATLRLDAMPDGLQYVRRTHEVWVTTPGARALTIVGVGGKAPGPVASIALDGEPEGLAVDETRGIFYTNLEDRDETLAIDVATRKIVARWPSRCGGDGPRGLAIDEAHRWLFVACTDGAWSVDAATGKPLGHLMSNSSGIDNLAYDPTPGRRALVIASSSRRGSVCFSRVDDDGQLNAKAPIPTAPGARNPVVDARGTTYVEDSAEGQLLVIRSRSLVP